MLKTYLKIKKRLIKTFNPLEIYLFGSYAWGTPNEDSDLDLAIIVDTYSKDRHQLLSDGYGALFGLKTANDLFIFTRAEFDLYSQDKSRLTFKIKHEGKKIYAKS